MPIIQKLQLFLCHTAPSRPQTLSYDSISVCTLTELAAGKMLLRTSPFVSLFIPPLLLLVMADPGGLSPIVVHRATAADTLLPGQPIRDNDQPLVSSNKTFALGFFSRGGNASSSRRYVGIWFNSIPGRDVVWVANVDSPLIDSSGTFTLQADGALVVSDKSRKVLWSSAEASSSNTTSTNSSISGILSAQLLETGNFVVKSSSSVLWEMFEANRGNTFIPGMRYILNRRTGDSRVYTSWASDDDPRPGKYRIGFDQSGQRKQLVLWQLDGQGVAAPGQTRWRTGQWDGQAQRFTEVDGLPLVPGFGFKYSDDATTGEMFFDYSVPSIVRARFVGTPGGMVEFYVSVAVGAAWNMVWQQPKMCELYNRCGNNAICSAEPADPQPTCDCLRGYFPKDAAEWSRGNWTGGCVRKAALLACQQPTTNSNQTITTTTGGNTTSTAGGAGGDWFFRVVGVKLPDLWKSVLNLDEDGCRGLCAASCSCIAYAYDTGIGCVFWDVPDLADMRVASNSSSSKKYDLHLRLAASEQAAANAAEEKKRSKKKVIAAAASSALAVALAISIIFASLLWRRRRNTRTEGFKWRNGDASGGQEGDDGESDHAPDLPILKFEVVAKATGNFDPSNLLGRGGFGPVYKGTLPTGKVVAVKRLSSKSGQGSEEFKNEVILIAKLQHRNLVRLLGCCIKGDDEKVLVYEYMPNKSLDAFLFDPKKRTESLDWSVRFKIIQGVARGLDYLHHDSRLRIVHRDLKASNILLDEGMEPKISDFGMARIFGVDQNDANTNRVVGTYGYMSPEYAMGGLFSVKSDVYSFGVLLLEIVSGQKNQIIQISGPTRNLLAHGWQLWSEGKAMEFVDPSISSCFQEKEQQQQRQEVMRCIQVGLLCVQDRPSDRPTMSSVVLMLASEAAGCPPPKQPTFTPEKRGHAETDSSSASCSRNTGVSSSDVTMTEITGR